jgi:hypothetical protein
MFSVRQFLQNQRNHLPLLYDPSQGLRPLFPVGYVGGISLLKSYVFRYTGSVQTSSCSADFLIGGDGSGRWLFATQLQLGSATSYLVSFVFSVTTGTSAYGFTITVRNSSNWNWITGIDPWIQQNWPSVFAGGIYGYLDDTTEDGVLSDNNAATENGYASLTTLQGAQQTSGDGPAIGEGADSGAAFPNIDLGWPLAEPGLPPSAGSSYIYSVYGPGTYPPGEIDPWANFDTAPLEVSATNGIGSSYFACWPDTSAQTGTTTLHTGTFHQNVIIIFVNNTPDTFLTLVGQDEQTAFAIQPPNTIWPLTAVEWADGFTSSSELTPDTPNGWATYYPFKNGQPPLGDSSKNITLSWKDPSFGSNTITASAPPPYKISSQGGDGSTAVVIYTLSE